MKENNDSVGEGLGILLLFKIYIKIFGNVKKNQYIYQKNESSNTPILAQNEEKSLNQLLKWLIP